MTALPAPSWVRGIDDPARLALIDRLALHGHLGDPDLNAVMTALSSACDVPMAVINIVTPDLQTYPAEFGVGAPCTHVPDALSFCAEVVTTGSALVVSDAASHPVYGRNPLVLAGAIGAYAGAPLLHDGQIIGSVSVFDARARAFTEPEMAVLGALTQLTAAVIRLRALAAWDELTGLASRPVLLDRTAMAVNRARAGGGLVAIAVLDVVGMSGINTEVGSIGGDVVLQVLAQRITSACGSRDSVARVGGDSFAVLFDEVASAEDARARASAAHTAATGPVTIGETTLAVALRCGLQTGHADGADALLAGAERGSAASVSTGLQTSTASVDLAPEAQELRRAIRTGQLVLHYHPVVDLTSNRVVGVEALVRWQHPTRGVVPPLEFIPLAESTGLIIELGEWVLRTAAAQAADWSAHGHPLDVAINISPRQMSSPDFAERTTAALQDVHAPSERIILEVTESALLDQPHAAATLETLRAQGIRLALDDFGTGYSSFSYLRRFPIDIIKIDRSFVSGMGVHADDDAIVASVVSLAHNTGKTVIAEGVETAQHVASLLDLGVQSGQGFLWTRPLPADQVLDWCDELEQGGMCPRSTAPTSPVPGPRAPALDSGEQQILHMHAEGASLHTIAAALNAQGSRTALGVRWHVRSVARVVAPQRVLPKREQRQPAGSADAVQRDHAGARRDDAADCRDAVADRRDQAAQQRDVTGQRRDAAAYLRDVEGSHRDDAAKLRDSAATIRDAVADDRDRLADERDRQQLRYRATDAPGDGAQVLLRSGAALRDAAADRERAQRDRQAGASERSESGADRTTALRDRGDGASDRGAAGQDRTSSLIDRSSGASERGGASADRSTAQADRGASAADRQQASIDSLTGAYLRGAGRTELEREILKARRSGPNLVLAFLDVDHLSTVNDLHGHAAGDALLVRVGAALRQHLRSYDLIVRFGGDEFFCALPGMDLVDAARRLALVNATLRTASTAGSVTVGIAELLGDDTADSLLERAHALLYAQRAGRAQR